MINESFLHTPKKHKKRDEEAKFSLSHITRLTLDKFEETELFPSTSLKNGATNNHGNKGTALDFLSVAISLVVHVI